MSLSRIALQNETSPKTCYTTYNVLQFRKNCIVEYEQAAFHVERHLDLLDENLKLSKDSYRGDISPTGRKRINKIVESWVLAIEHNNKNQAKNVIKDYRKLNMITLTLSDTQIHSDEHIKKAMLKPFLRIIRERKVADNYLWRAEKQENGNIHFHILLDKFIDKDFITDAWNKIQEKVGYLDRFKSKFGRTNAPSTQVESIRNAHDTVKYISKYLTKDSEYGLISGAVWKASKKLSTLDYFSVNCNYSEREALELSVKNKDCEVKANDNCTIYKFKDLRPLAFLVSHAKVYYSLYLMALRGFMFTDVDCEDFKVYYNKLICDYNKKYVPDYKAEYLQDVEQFAPKPNQLSLFVDIELKKDLRRFI